MLHATVDLPRPGIAEDAPPLVAGGPDVRLIGVFDGLGGAGARKVGGEDGFRSSAYYASRAAREAALAVMEQGPRPAPSDAAGVARQFSLAIGRALALRRAATPAGAGPVRSALLRDYPTTAAMLLAETGPRGAAALAMWAGDSRCYALSAMAGLQQLSRDDSRTEADPMAALRDDPPMTNMLTGDAACSLHGRLHRFGGPVLLLVATDGAFGCLPSPMHFELALLRALSDARDAGQWANDLANHLAALAADDVSLAALFLGWRRLPEAAADFAQRLQWLSALLAPCDRAPPGRGSALLQAAWQAYRPTYLALSPRADAGPWR